MNRYLSIVLVMHYARVRIRFTRNLYIMNTSFSEHFLDSSVGVHYREVSLYYRRILRINCRDMIQNEDIRNRISRERTIIDTIRKRKLGLFGHICRMDDNRLVKHTVLSQMEGKSRRGRPCREWLDDIIEWCQRSRQDLLHLAQDRQAWKNLIL